MAAGPVWIGVDGGGTGSRVVVGDAAGRTLGAARGRPGLIDPADPYRAAAAVADTVRAAAAAARIGLPARGLWAGLAGAGQLRAREAVEAALREAGVAERVKVGTDLEAAHADAFGEGPGVLLVVGTGSALRAVAPDGAVVTVGGWGQLLGDEGSGYAIGLAGLRAVMRAGDGREAPTSLSDVLAGAGPGDGGAGEPSLREEAPGGEAGGVVSGGGRPGREAGGVLSGRGASDREAGSLVEWAARASKRDIAALSVAVAKEARRGDPVAARIVHRALGDIRAHLEAAMERAGGWAGAPVVALVGGLVREGRPLRRAVGEMVAELGCRVHRMSPCPSGGRSGARCGCDIIRCTNVISLHNRVRCERWVAQLRTPISGGIRRRPR